MVLSHQLSIIASWTSMWAAYCMCACVADLPCHDPGLACCQVFCLSPLVCLFLPVIRMPLCLTCGHAVYRIVMFRVCRLYRIRVQSNGQCTTAMRCRFAGPVRLGQHPDTNEDIVVRQGRYGPYLQLGTKDSPSAVQQVPKGTRRPANNRAATNPKRTARTSALK